MTWQQISLKKIADVVSGFGFPRDYQGLINEEIPFFKVSDMNLPGNELKMHRGSNTISRVTLRKLNAKTFPVGTVIFPKIGAAIATEKKRILAGEATFDNNVMGLVPSDSLVGKFLFYWLLTFELQSIANIGPVPSLRKTTVEKLPFNLPPLSEQRRIVELLDQADALRKKRAEADAKAERILPALFIKMFGDPVTNPKGWQVQSLGDLLTDIESGWSPKCDTRAAEEDEWGVLKLSAVTYGHFQSSENKAMLFGTDPKEELEVKRGDLLITRKNTHDLVGATAFVHETRPKLLLPDLIFRLCLIDQVDPVYVWQALSQNSMRYQLSQLAGGTAGSMPNISKTRLRTLSLPVPPISLQKTFREYVTNSWHTQNRQKCSIAKLETLFQALLHRAFSGDLTAEWRKAHMAELLQEMEHQARVLGLEGEVE
jgi:type I restriction enzyme S subunit